MKKSERPSGCKTVFVGGLAFDIDEEKLRAHFGSCGSINTIRWGEDKTTGDFKGYAHIVFDDEEAVDAAVVLSGSELMGRSIRVDFAMDVRNNNNNNNSRDGDRKQNDRGGGRVSVCVRVNVVYVCMDRDGDWKHNDRGGGRVLVCEFYECGV
jgi:nucleolin